MLDCFPILRRLPDFLVPVRVRARKLHERELQLFRGYYLNAKQQLKDGTAKVRSGPSGAERCSSYTNLLS